MILLYPGEMNDGNNIKNKKQKTMLLLRSEKSIHILIMIWGVMSWTFGSCLMNLRKRKVFNMMEKHLQKNKGEFNRNYQI